MPEHLTAIPALRLGGTGGEPVRWMPAAGDPGCLVVLGAAGAGKTSAAMLCGELAAAAGVAVLVLDMGNGDWELLARRWASDMPISWPGGVDAVGDDEVSLARCRAVSAEERWRAIDALRERRRQIPGPCLLILDGADKAPSPTDLDELVDAAGPRTAVVLTAHRPSGLPERVLGDKALMLLLRGPAAWQPLFDRLAFSEAEVDTCTGLIAGEAILQRTGGARQRVRVRFIDQLLAAKPTRDGG